jgi:general secretion pathway protein N
MSGRLPWMAGLIGAVVALVAFAPARWLAEPVGAATQGQLQLVNAQGTVWNGRADVLVSGGEGSRDRATLPQGVRWRLAPTLVRGWPAASLAVSLPCCSPAPVAMRITARPGTSELIVDRFSSRWPAALLAGLGTPWNTLRLEGALELNSPGFTLKRDSGRLQLDGSVVVDAVDMASRLSTLRPLGSYRATLQAAPDGNTATLNLQTVRGELLLQGEGLWIGGRLRFSGDARAAAGREEPLSNLLNIVGRRQGDRSIITLG